MSFSSNAKEELIRQRFKSREERLSAFCALTHAAGSITIGGGRFGVRYALENYSVGKLIGQLAMGLAQDVHASLAVSESDRLKARNTIVRLSGSGCVALLSEAGFLSVRDGELSIDGEIPSKLVSGEERARAFLRGAFLGAGSVSDPEKGYHLEFVCRSPRFFRAVFSLLQAGGFGAKEVERAGNSVLYIKDSERICAFLAYINANSAVLGFENTRVVKDVKNRINRVTNCDSGNMQKTAMAAARQRSAIDTIRGALGLDALSPPLREAAEARWNNPEATLGELAELCGATKSGMNHRLGKLVDMANAMRGEE